MYPQKNPSRHHPHKKHSQDDGYPNKIGKITDQSFLLYILFFSSFNYTSIKLTHRNSISHRKHYISEICGIHITKLRRLPMPVKPPSL